MVLVLNSTPQGGCEYIVQGKFCKNDILGWFVKKGAPLKGAKVDLKKFLPCGRIFAPIGRVYKILFKKNHDAKTLILFVTRF